MEPIKLNPKEALALISDCELVTTHKNKAGTVFSEMLNRADVAVIVSHEEMFYDPQPEKERFKVFYVDTEDCRVYMETKSCEQSGESIQTFQLNVNFEIIGKEEGEV